MTRHQDLQHQRHSLSEIINILSAMKTLAYMENHKLGTFLDSQHRVVDAITSVANDFLSFYPEMAPKDTEVDQVFLLIGSERGFCGDFNQALVRHIEPSLNVSPRGRQTMIVVGRKLWNLISDDAPVYARLAGPSIVEEVPAILEQTVQELAKLQKEQPLLNLYSVYHSGNNKGVVTKKLLPPFQQTQKSSPSFPYPPLLNLPPPGFLLDIAEQYLFAVLHQLFYTSLIEENRSRIVHLEGAVKHLESAADELSQQLNVLRREEIIEEIEVLLLSAGSLDEDWFYRT